MGTHPIFESDFDCLTERSAKMKCKGDLREFMITGRKLPSDSQSSPPLYRVRLFAPDPIAAKSRFWYFVSYYKKVNKTAGEIVSVKKVAEKDCRRTNIQQLHNSQIRFPLPRKIMSKKAQNAPRFTTKRPNTMDV